MLWFHIIIILLGLCPEPSSILASGTCQKRLAEMHITADLRREGDRVHHIHAIVMLQAALHVFWSTADLQDVCRMQWLICPCLQLWQRQVEWMNLSKFNFSESYPHACSLFLAWSCLQYVAGMLCGSIGLCIWVEDSYIKNAYCCHPQKPLA